MLQPNLLELNKLDFIKVVRLFMRVTFGQADFSLREAKRVADGIYPWHGREPFTVENIAYLCRLIAEIRGARWPEERMTVVTVREKPNLSPAFTGALNMWFVDQFIVYPQLMLDREE